MMNRFYRSSDYGSCSNAQINHPAPAIATGDRLVDHKSQALGYGTPLSGFSSTSFSRTNGDSSSRGLLSNESTSPGYGSFASSSQEDTIQPTVTPQALRRNVSPPGGSYSSHTNLATRGPGDLGTDPLAAVGGRFSGVNSTGQYERNGNQDQHLGINGVSKRPIGNSTYPGSSTSTNEVSWFPTVNIGGLSDYPARFPAFNPQRSYQGGTLSSTRSPSLGDLPQESPNLQEPHNSRLMPLNETSPYYAFTTGGQVLFSARSSDPDRQNAPLKMPLYAHTAAQLHLELKNRGIVCQISTVTSETNMKEQKELSQLAQCQIVGKRLNDRIISIGI
ncbi:hypothetical protein ACLMJK_002212 [Lecanora helva]